MRCSSGCQKTARNVIIGPRVEGKYHAVKVVMVYFGLETRYGALWLHLGTLLLLSQGVNPFDRTVPALVDANLVDSLSDCQISTASCDGGCPKPAVGP